MKKLSILERSLSPPRTKEEAEAYMNEMKKEMDEWKKFYQERRIYQRSIASKPLRNITFENVCAQLTSEEKSFLDDSVDLKTLLGRAKNLKAKWDIVYNNRCEAGQLVQTTTHAVNETLQDVTEQLIQKPDIVPRPKAET